VVGFTKINRERTLVNKLVKVVSLAIVAFFALTAEGCPADDPGKSGSSRKVTVWDDGETTLGIQNSRKTMHATNPKDSCSWTLMYDIPHTKKVVVVGSGGAKSAKKGVKMWGPGTITYRDPNTHKMVKIKAAATSFYSENCGPWTNR
jgi:hypothetical protein